MASNNSKEAKKKKMPTALKRDKQNEKRRIRNKAIKSRIRTSMKSLITAIDSKEGVAEKLSNLYSLMDKGVKKGIVKKNKANRIKSRYRIKAGI